MKNLLVRQINYSLICLIYTIKVLQVIPEIQWNSDRCGGAFTTNPSAHVIDKESEVQRGCPHHKLTSDRTRVRMLIKIINFPSSRVMS